MDSPPAAWALAVLAAAALALGGMLWHSSRTALRSGPFADRVADALERPEVRAAVAQRVEEAVIAARPDLLTVRPLIAAATERVVGTAAFRALVRRAALEAHRSAFRAESDTPAIRIRDSGVLVAEALEGVRPGLASRIPPDVKARAGRISGGIDGFFVDLAQRADHARRLALIALVLALLLGAGVFALSGGRRMAVFRLGCALMLAGAAALLGCALAPRAASSGFDDLDGDAVAAIVHVWLDPLVPWAVAMVLIGLLWAAAARPARTGTRVAHRARRLGVAAGVACAAVVAAAALASAGAEPEIARIGRCNGAAALCDRRLDEVAFLGTHNSMSADREPGWLFAAQDAGIPEQLEEGVRALLVDTHYGFPAGSRVVTDLSGETKSRAKLVDEVGESFVETAERIRRRHGPERSDERGVYLCHAFCEVGSTEAVAAFAGVHRFLVTHPEEVLVLSIEDDTQPEDTVEVIRRSGLIDEVYRGPARPPWPTLRDMIERGERVLVLAEDDPGDEPWMHLQPAVAQETPYRFETAGELAAPSTCEPNRGGTAGSLMLVNHWVDTSPAPRVTIAARVNARDFIDHRLSLCRAKGRPSPTVLAVDFYATGDAGAVVDRVNGG